MILEEKREEGVRDEMWRRTAVRPNSYISAGAGVSVTEGL